jgi:hypothetical protein
MRCLYCGKELALLKRWTGGGEFCTDAHRQRYQEEYNQLALNRLLQAKPPSEAVTAAPEVKPVAPPRPVAPEPKAESAPLKVSEPARAYREQAHHLDQAHRVGRELPTPASLRMEWPEPKTASAVLTTEPAPAPIYRDPVLDERPIHEIVEPEPDHHEAADEPAPAELGRFFVEMPAAPVLEPAPAFQPEMEWLYTESSGSELPIHLFQPAAQDATNPLELAGLISLSIVSAGVNCPEKGPKERRLEIRDAGRIAPVIKIDLRPAGKTGLPKARDPFDVSSEPALPQAQPDHWQVPAVAFAAVKTELGALARLAFPTTGFAGQDEPVAEVAPQPVAAASPAFPAPEKQNLRDPIPVRAAVEPTEKTEAAQALEEIAPVAPAEPFADAAPQAEATFQIVEPEPVVTRPAPPERPLAPRPIAFQIVIPGKAKPTQVFSSAPISVDAQVPRLTSLPLRPVIVFGPPVKKEVPNEAPKPSQQAVEKPAVVKPADKPVSEKKAPEMKAEPAKVEPAKSETAKPQGKAAPLPIRADVRSDLRPDPRVSSAKTRQPEPAKESLLKQAAKAEAPAAVKPSAKLDPRPEKKQDFKEVRPQETAKAAPAAMPAPLAAPYPGSNDLGLPRLNLQTSPGFWGGLPVVAKIVIVLVLVAGLGSLIAFSSKSGGAAVTSNSGPGTIVAGSLLPIGDAGWITDWGADPGVRRTRQISVLRSSQTLTDYRIEMQGQIETKAIGWIFRASDPKDYYVTKLEIVKPGLQPTVALIRFAIINGEEQTRAQIPLPMPVRRDTLYKIRFDAVGNHFTTYVQDQKVDEWTDSRVKTGGVGLYSERGEVATLKGGMNVVPLILKR